jgi:hypothetical protein
LDVFIIIHIYLIAILLQFCISFFLFIKNCLATCKDTKLTIFISINYFLLNSPLLIGSLPHVHPHHSLPFCYHKSSSSSSSSSSSLLHFMIIALALALLLYLVIVLLSSHTSMLRFLVDN